jgi:lysozyme
VQPISDLTPALTIIKKWEGCRLEAYQDQGGVWTIGWGDTTNVLPGMIITQASADQRLAGKVKIFSTDVESDVNVPCSNNAMCAMVSLAYNIGPGAFKGSLVLRTLNAGKNRALVASAFMDWIHVDGVVDNGLVNRRKDEVALFMS